MQFPVGSNVVPLFPSGSDAALTLFNNGPSIIYIGSDTALNSNTGFPLAVGSAIVWDKGNPLFIVCAKGYASTLYAVENSGPSSLGTVALSGSVSLAPGATVGLADGSHVALAPGSEVALADGATVSLTSGTAVTLESGTAVTLADGSTVNLASGATVDIATGATVGLQSGTAVDLASGASVKVNSLPITVDKYWPCISGENYPPTLTNATYTTYKGQACVSVGSSNYKATYSSLNRYGINVSETLTVSFLLYPTSGVMEMAIGYLCGVTHGACGIQSTTGVDMLTVDGVTPGPTVDFTPYVNTWVKVSMIFSKTYTKVRFNDDPTTDISTGPVADSSITGGWYFTCVSSPVNYSNLQASYG